MGVMPIVLQQAVFTSLQAGENEGYQIASHSPGVGAETVRELTAWGPSHDSLQPEVGAAGSINGHLLSDGRYCLSLTRATSGEYSGRGANVESSLLIAATDGLALCGFHPLRLLEAALGAGWTSGDVKEEITLVGRSQSVNLEAISQACGIFSPESLAALVERVQDKTPLAVLLTNDQRLLIDALYSLLPPGVRSSVSFTTGLLPSAKRAFHLHLLKPQTELKHLFTRTTGGQLLELSDPELSPEKAWGRQLAEKLKSQQWSEVRRFVLGE
jgi:GTPase-associated protein 1